VAGEYSDGSVSRSPAPTPVTDVLSKLTASLANRYRIERALGQGGMATVYLAHDLRHDRDVAIKVLHPDLGAALGGERFLSEIRTTARLQHPHILPLLDSGNVDGLLYYVMPLVTGETLRARLERERQLPIADALRISREVADALGYAHSLGVIHRDIKPENILLQGGHALVADFGIALAVQSAGGARMTQTGLSLGTPQYMSPEQAMGERTIDARSDIYALGAVTYEMLAGDPPFTGSSVQAIVARILTERPASIATVRDTVPRSVEHAVLTALAKLPADRYASAADFATALTATHAPNMNDRSALRPARNRWQRVAIGAMASAALLALVTSWRWLRPHVPAEPVTRVAVALPPSQELRPAYFGYSIDLSSDGTRLVYVGRGSIVGATQLWIRRLDALEGTPVAGTEGAISAQWSPDAKSIFFYTARRSFTISLDGGQVLPFADSRVDIAWGSTGDMYFTQRPRSAILRRRAEGGIDSIAPFDTVFNALTISITPDERTLLIGRQRRTIADTSAPEIVALSIESGTQTVIAPGLYAQLLASGKLLYVTAGGDAFVSPFNRQALRITGSATPVARIAIGTTSGAAHPQITVSDNGTLMYLEGALLRQRLDLFDARGRVERRLDIEGDIWGLSLSPDGSRVAFSVKDNFASSGRSVGVGDTWVADLRSGARTRLTSEWLNARPSWSADGQHVLFTRVGGPIRQALYERRADGGEPERLVLSIAQFGHSVNDGRWIGNSDSLLISTYAQAGTGIDLYATRAGGLDGARAVAVTPAGESRGIASPNGKLVAYLSDETGTAELYVQPVVGGGRVKVSHGGSSGARWSRDGRELYFWNGQGQLMATRISAAPALAVVGSREVGGEVARAQAANQDDGLFDVAPDGRLLVATEVKGSFRLVLVRNWMAGLGK